jgi:hypothetical protein
MKQGKNVLKPLLAVAVLALLTVILLVVYDRFKPQTVQGSKEIVVEVVIPDEEDSEFTLHTDAEYLGQALDEEKMIKGNETEYGRFITELNGRTADGTKEEWWCITKDGADVYTGIDQTPIMDGDHYEITLKTGYESYN